LVDTRTSAGRLPLEGRADDELSFALAVGRGEIEEGDARRHRIPSGSDRLVAAGRAPDLTYATAAERQAAYLAEFSECPFFHLLI
jgi:hypothetical protein